MKNIKVSTDISHILSKVALEEKGFGRFTADQWRIFFQIYTIPCIWDMLDKDGSLKEGGGHNSNVPYY